VRAAPIAVLVLAACGPPAMTGVGTRHAPRTDDVIELSLRTTDGRVVELADQRGGPVLLFLFATYDGASIASNRGLYRFARAAQDTVVLGVALQLDAETFARAFAESQLPPYTVTYDSDGAIVRGASDLGPFEAVPTFVMIDAHGVECARHVGYASERVLWNMHEIALSRGGIAEPTPTPPPADVDETPASAVEETPSSDPETPPGEADGPREGEIVIEPDEAHGAEPLPSP
jgi:hypothetical protein